VVAGGGGVNGLGSVIIAHSSFISWNTKKIKKKKKIKDKKYFLFTGVS
jgi:hypothetical protein